MLVLSRLKTISKRLKNATLATAFVATQLVVPLSSSGLFNSHVAALSNEGDVKVRELGDVNQIPENNPMLSGCSVVVEFYNFDNTTDKTASVLFTGQAPTEDAGIHVSGASTSPTVEGDGDADGKGKNDLDGSYTYTLSFTGTPKTEGSKTGYHVDLAVDVAGTNGGAKHKQFWMPASCQQEEELTPVTPVVEATTPTCEEQSMVVTPQAQEGVTWLPATATTMEPGDGPVTYVATLADGYKLADGAQAEWGPYENTFDPSTCEHVSTDGSITIKKNAKPDSTQAFSFTTTGTGLDDFSLTDDSDPGLPSKPFSNLGAGRYTITEGTTDGWYLSGITCTKDGAVVTKNVNDRKVTITLDGSEQNVSCTFTNKKFKKVFVCKYVGTPHVDERLQNIISVSVNAIENNQWDGTVPGWFSDAHDRSYVLAYDVGQATPDLSECPAPEEPTVVTPTNPTFVNPTCEVGSTGSYTIPEEEGVVYMINGEAVDAGTYQAAKGSTVTITAEPAEGYVFSEGATTSWTHTFSTSGCTLGETDVCQNLPGTQATVPNGYIKDTKTGNCIKNIGGKGGGQVLGASTQLPNTGSNVIFSTLAGIMLITLALGTRVMSRRSLEQS